VSGVRNPVNNGHRARCVNFIGPVPYRVNTANDIGAMCKRHHPRAFVQQLIEVCWIQLGSFRVYLPLADHHTFRFQPAPGANIGFMVLVGNNDFITGFEVRSQSLRYDIGILRC